MYVSDLEADVSVNAASKICVLLDCHAFFARLSHRNGSVGGYCFPSIILIIGLLCGGDSHSEAIRA